MRRVLLTSAVVAGALFATATPLRAQSQAYDMIGAFSDVLAHVRQAYPDTVGYPQMIQAAIEGVLTSLDPHSYFLPRADHTRHLAFERGELASAGLQVEVVDGRATVLAVREGGPADRARIQAGDRLLAIDDTSTAGVSGERLALWLAGERGSRLRIMIARGPLLDPDTFRISLRRETVLPRAVTFTTMADSVTGLIRLAEFAPNAAQEVDRALKQLKDRGMRRAVLDLRGNPGGRVVEAREIASLFLQRSLVVYREVGRGSNEQQIGVLRDGDWKDLPLVVLMDATSASASEIVAGALQDNDRAVIVGRRSFGKALVQTPFVLRTGDVIYLTIARLQTPSHRSIQRSYGGLRPAQYYAMYGTAGAPDDTLRLYLTSRGRPIRGGGGIAPDVETAPSSRPPAWWAVTADSAFDTAVADSVAGTLPATPAARDAWIRDSAGWARTLLPPFLARVRNGLRIAAIPDAGQEATIARIMATRVAEVRWGPAARDALRLRNDADLQAALATFPRLEALLAPTRP